MKTWKEIFDKHNELFKEELKVINKPYTDSGAGRNAEFEDKKKLQEYKAQKEILAWVLE